MTISALICAKNEQDFVELCLKSIEPYVDEIIFVNNCSTDNTKQVLSAFPSSKIKLFDYPETKNMGELRQFSLNQATGDFIWQIDCDEIYPKESCEAIRAFCENPGEAISARVSYSNLAWKDGHRQAHFEHYPDRIYKREVVDEYSGVLPNDMTKVKKEFYTFRPFLEYDNVDDRSFENPKQPIINAHYYHLARTRGYNFEYKKWFQYNKNIHPTKSEAEIEEMTKSNSWVAGDYPMEKIEVPNCIPTTNIQNPKVSVIVTCYNKADYIGETLQSILDQTHPVYELIVVDDCSTDNSADIIHKYPVSSILTPHKNMGVSRARNWGLDMVTGDYFILIDGDDKLHPTYIERCLAEMKGDVQIVYSDFQGMGEWDWAHSYPHPFNKENLRTAQVFPSVMALCDRHLISRYGNFREELLSEDFGWWITLVFERNANVVHIPEPLCYYRRTTGSRVDQVDKERGRATQQLKDTFRQYSINPL